MKAMILAAGRGERLRPLSDLTPKPLLKVGGQSLIEYHLYNLAKIGITEVIVNVHHLKEQIMEYLGDGQRYGIRVRYSIEEPELLETGGGIFKALNEGLLNDEAFVLISADVWTAFPLQVLTQAIQQDAHLVLVDNPAYHSEGDYGLKGEWVTQTSPKLTYASLGVLHPRLFKGCVPGRFRLAPLLEQAIDEKRVTGVHYSGPWFNIGTAAELEKLKQSL